MCLPALAVAAVGAVAGSTAISAIAGQGKAKGIKKNANFYRNTMYDLIGDFEDNNFYMKNKGGIEDIFAGLIGLGGKDPTETLRATPGYQWTLDQGMQALETSAAAKGGLFSGAAGLEALKFGQGLADQTYQQTFSNFAGLVGNIGAVESNILDRKSAVEGTYLGQKQAATEAYNDSWNTVADGVASVGAIASGQNGFNQALELSKVGGGGGDLGNILKSIIPNTEGSTGGVASSPFNFGGWGGAAPNPAGGAASTAIKTAFETGKKLFG